MILWIATPCSLIDDINYSNGPAASIFSVDNKKTVAKCSPVKFVPPGGTTQHDNWGRQEHLRPYMFAHLILLKELLVIPRRDCFWRSWWSFCFSQGCLYVMGAAISLRYSQKPFPHLSRPALVQAQSPIQWVPSLFPEVKAAGAWHWTPTPI